MSTSPNFPELLLNPQEQAESQGFGAGEYGGQSPPYGEGAAPSPPPPQIVPGPGFVRPSDTRGELNDLMFRQMLQQVVSGITGIDGTLVFPRWQEEPPNQPDFNVDWAAVGPNAGDPREREVFPVVFHSSYEDGEGNEVVTDTVMRNELISLLASFYGPNADQTSEYLAMGLGLEQNRYMLQLNGCSLVEVNGSVTVPEFVKERWLMRVDLPFRVRRQQRYTYPTANLVAVRATLITDDGQKPRDVSVLPGYGRWTKYGQGPYQGK